MQTPLLPHPSDQAALSWGRKNNCILPVQALTQRTVGRVELAVWLSVCVCVRLCCGRGKRWEGGRWVDVGG